ncbi:vegetative cell wall protein gp1-like [Miscanthus floridulus]|uniref:vegetative cell wall protein gp1-like n=1 Tax=Miscanthus floridulus TaxID=154761 RepID=UPI00345786F9
MAIRWTQNGGAVVLRQIQHDIGCPTDAGPRPFPTDAGPCHFPSPARPISAPARLLLPCTRAPTPPRPRVSDPAANARPLPGGWPPLAGRPRTARAGSFPCASRPPQDLQQLCFAQWLTAVFNLRHRQAAPPTPACAPSPPTPARATSPHPRAPSPPRAPAPPRPRVFDPAADARPLPGGWPPPAGRPRTARVGSFPCAGRPPQDLLQPYFARWLTAVFNLCASSAHRLQPPLVPATSRSARGAEPTGDKGMLHASYDDDICNVAGGGCLLDYP